MEVRVHVESSTWMECGRSPCERLDAPCERLDDTARTYGDNWLLSLNTSSQLVLLDLDNQVLALIVSWDLEGDIDILDGLCPLVWERILLSFLLRECSSLDGWIWGLFDVCLSC